MSRRQMSDGMLFLPGAFPSDRKVVRPIVQTWAVKRDDKGKKKRGQVGPGTLVSKSNKP